jgi:hypothetical protein
MPTGGGICELKHRQGVNTRPIPSGVRFMYPALPLKLLERGEEDNTVSQRNTYLSQAILASTLVHARAKYRRRHDIMNWHLILPAGRHARCLGSPKYALSNTQAASR